jgi:hypothetical protein
MNDSKFTFSAPAPSVNVNKLERPTAQSFYNFKHFMKAAAPTPLSDSEDGEMDMDLDESDNFISFDMGQDTAPATIGQNASGSKIDYYQDSRQNTQPAIINVDPLLLEIPTPGWIDKDRRYSSNILNFLQQETEDFCRFMEPTEAEISLRKITVERLKRVTDTVFKSYKVCVFLI